MVSLPAEVDADVNVVSYFLSRREGKADSEEFLAVVVPQLAYLCDEEPPHPSDRHEFRALWRRAVDRAEETGRHLLLVVDGLDEDQLPAGPSMSVANLLPTLVGAHAHVLLASRPYPDLPIDGDHPLKETRPVKLAPFEGAHEVADRARQEIDDLTGDGLAVDVLGLLTAAAGPLSVDDLAALSCSTDVLSAHQQRRQVRQIVARRAARSLEQVGSDAHPRYQFAHYSLLEHAQKNEDLTDPGVGRSGPPVGRAVARQWMAHHDGPCHHDSAVLARHLLRNAHRRSGSIGDTGH